MDCLAILAGPIPNTECFGMPYQEELMKFAEAALFRMAVSRRVRSEVRQGRVDARSVRGIWLGKTLVSDEHLFATDDGVSTTRTVKRVLHTEQRLGELVNDGQGTPWDRLAGRPAGRPRKSPPQATPVATLPSAEAEERRSVFPAELCWPLFVPFLPPSIIAHPPMRFDMFNPLEVFLLDEFCAPPPRSGSTDQRP